MRPEILIPTHKERPHHKWLGVAAPTNGENVALRPKIENSK